MEGHHRISHLTVAGRWVNSRVEHPIIDAVTVCKKDKQEKLDLVSPKLPIAPTLSQGENAFGETEADLCENAVETPESDKLLTRTLHKEATVRGNKLHLNIFASRSILKLYKHRYYLFNLDRN